MTANGVSLRDGESVLKLVCDDGCIACAYAKTTELYTLHGYIVWYTKILIKLPKMSSARIHNIL